MCVGIAKFTIRPNTQSDETLLLECTYTIIARDKLSVIKDGKKRSSIFYYLEPILDRNIVHHSLELKEDLKFIYVQNTKLTTGVRETRYLVDDLSLELNI